MTCNLYGKVCRGGASEASGATFTDHFAGARDVVRALVCIYVCILFGPITPRTRNGAESVIFDFTGKRNSGKKDLLLRSGLKPGSYALQTTAFTTEPMGL